VTFYTASRHDQWKRKLKGLSALLLLALYICGNVEVENLHEFLHAHEIVITHAAEEEKDPCHRSIYHDDVLNDCKHESHYAKSEKCDLCDSIFHPDQVAISHSTFVVVKSSHTNQSRTKSVDITDLQIHLPARAPPAV
jgi:hypothetical protein